MIIIGAGLLYWFVLRSPRLVLNPSPENAVVTVDGSALHTTSLPLPAGAHQVKVEAPGFVPYQKTISLNRAQMLTIHVLLKPIPSPITLSSDVENYPSFAKGSEVFFLGNKGKTLYHTKNNPGQATLRVEAMTPDTLSGILEVIWRPDGEVAFLKRSDGIYLYDFMRYDLLHQTMTLWGANIDAIAWDPRGGRAVYTFYGANGEQSLKFADIQNKNVSIVGNLAKDKIDHPTLQWAPNGESILLIARSAQQKTNYMYTFDIFSKKITQLTDVGEVQGGTWSPDSKAIAYVAPGRDANGGNTSIVWVANADGSGVRPLNVVATDSSKVAWVNNSQSLIVARPTTDGNEELVNVTLNGEVRPYQYHAPQGHFTPQHITTTPGDERILFFNDGKYISLPLITADYE